MSFLAPSSEYLKVGQFAMVQYQPESSPKHNNATQLSTCEDAEMRAARRELKQSSIYDLGPSTRDHSPNENSADTCPVIPPDDGSDAHHEEPKTKATSPKRKRSHDQLEWEQSIHDNDTTSITSTDSAKDRALRLEPEKKRQCDEESTEAIKDSTKLETQAATQKSKEEDGSNSEKSTETSSTAFAASGFGKLAQGSSAFAALGALGSTGFASSAQSSATSVNLPKPPQAIPASVAPKLTFCGSASASPFAGLLTGNNRLDTGGNCSLAPEVVHTKAPRSFAGLGGTSFQSRENARPFGAPESESDAEDEDTEEQGETSQTNEPPRTPSPDTEVDDKRKTKLHKVDVDDGEAEEATIVSVRAKMFCLDKETGWKERGVGMLKINVPRGCVQLDGTGVPVPGSFDASKFDVGADFDGQSHKVARLIMRQDQTHRVILNTCIVPTMQLEEKASLKSVGIIFTAFEGEEARPMRITMRMNATNAKIFMTEFGLVQKALMAN